MVPSFVKVTLPAPAVTVSAPPRFKVSPNRTFAPAPAVVVLIATAPVSVTTAPLKVTAPLPVVMFTPLIVAASIVTVPLPVKVMAPSTLVLSVVVKSISPVEPLIPAVTLVRLLLATVRSFAPMVTDPVKDTLPVALPIRIREYGVPVFERVRLSLNVILAPLPVSRVATPPKVVGPVKLIASAVVVMSADVRTPFGPISVTAPSAKMSPAAAISTPGKAPVPFRVTMPPPAVLMVLFKTTLAVLIMTP